MTPFPEDERHIDMSEERYDAALAEHKRERAIGARNLDDNMSARVYRYFVSLRERWNRWCDEDRVRGLHAGKTFQVMELERMYKLDREDR